MKTCGRTAIHPGWGQLGKAEREKIKAIEAGIPREKDGSMCVYRLQAIKGIMWRVTQKPKPVQSK